MSNRELVIRHVKKRMMTAFIQGHLIDAQNMDAYLMTLEQMSDQDYDDLEAAAEEEISGAIS